MKGSPVAVTPGSYLWKAYELLFALLRRNLFVKLPKETIMSTNQILSYENQELTVKHIDGSEYLKGTDIARALGYKNSSRA